MSEIIEAITGMIEVIADNPSSILIVLGFIALLIGLLLPLGIGIQVLLGGTGFLMMIFGIALNIMWVQN